MRHRSDAGTPSIPSHSPAFTPGETGLPGAPVSWCGAEHDRLAWGILTDSLEVRDVRRKLQEAVTRKMLPHPEAGSLGEVESDMYPCLRTREW